MTRFGLRAGVFSTQLAGHFEELGRRSARFVIRAASTAPLK